MLFFIALLGCYRSSDESITPLNVSKDASESTVQTEDIGRHIEELRRIGARIELDDRGQAIVISFSHLQINDGDLARLSSLRTITHLHLEGTQITDAGLAHITDLTSLRLVNVGQTKVTRAGRQKLRETCSTCSRRCGRPSSATSRPSMRNCAATDRCSKRQLRCTATPSGV